MIDLNLTMTLQEDAFSCHVPNAEERLQALIVLCVKEDRLAQSKLYKQCFGFMYRIAIRYEKHHDDAIVVINEAFFNILTTIHKYDSKNSFYPWAKTILIHCIINKFKKEHTIKNGRDNPRVSIEDEMVYTSVEADIEKQIDSQHVLAILQSLPECTRKVFNFYVIEGYSHKEIAEMLGISINTSKWHLANGKKKLSETLNPLNKTLKP